MQSGGLQLPTPKQAGSSQSVSPLPSSSMPLLQISTWRFLNAETAMCIGPSAPDCDRLEDEHVVAGGRGENATVPPEAPPG